jgi:hypothetical protein
MVGGCTTSYAAPIADTIVALGLAVSSAYLISKDIGHTAMSPAAK